MGAQMSVMLKTKKPENIFPASFSNQITYEYFCLLGGLENKNTRKIEHHNGSYVYFTYHLICVQ
jgi:hypothetical protein